MPSSASCSPKARAVVVAGHEDVEHLLLHLAGETHGGGVVRSCAHDRGEARRRAVHELDAFRAHDHVVGGAEPQVGDRRRVLRDVGHGLDALLGQQRRDAGVERSAEVGEPQVLGWRFGQKLARHGEHAVHVGELLDLLAGQPVDDRQVVPGIGELDHVLGTMRFFDLRERGFGLGDDRMCAADRRGSDDLRH